MATIQLLTVLILPLCFGRAASEATQLCGILDQRSAIVGDQLYFSSGNYTFNDGRTWHNSSSLYALPLDAPVDVTGSIPLSSLQISPLPSDELAGGVSPIAGGASGTFLYDHTTLYAYGGIIGGNANGTQNGLWTYNTTNSTWGLTIVEGGALSFGDDTAGLFANDPSQSISFYTGGWEMAYNNTNNGIVKLDSSDPAQPQWTFLTAQGGTMQGPDILKGSMVFVRKGQAGILVAFGGFNTTRKGTQFGPGWDWDYQDMSNIFVYDIFSNVWYLVEATGEVPPYRGEFCSGVSSAPDDSSFQITMHGGYDLLADNVLDDVYILSLPGFRWIHVNAQNDPDKGYGRNRHTCSMWEDAQMIVSGSWTADTCDQSRPPIKVLNTSSYIWQTHFEPDAAAYSIPDVVRAQIGGDSSGGASVTSPDGGWKNQDLKTVFSYTRPRDTYVYTNTTASPKHNGSANGTSSKKQHKKSNHTGAIAGGVVGGVVGLSMLAVAFWYIKTRRSNSQGTVEGEADRPDWKKAELSSDPLGELESTSRPAQLESKTDRAELDDQRRAVEVGQVKSPTELDASQGVGFSRDTANR